jgi:hypothetical protein
VGADRSSSSARGKGRWRRGGVGLAVAAALLIPSTAAADKPIREGLPAEDFTIQGSCAFDVGLQVLVNKEFITTFSDGRQLITGQLVVRLTNVDTGKPIDPNISGPAFSTPHEDGSVTFQLSGRSLVFLPGLLELTSGPAVLEIDPAGNVVGYTKTSAAAVDLDAVLADP